MTEEIIEKTITMEELYHLLGNATFFPSEVSENCMLKVVDDALIIKPKKEAKLVNLQFLFAYNKNKIDKKYVDTSDRIKINIDVVFVLRKSNIENLMIDGIDFEKQVFMIYDELDFGIEINNCKFKNDIKFNLLGSTVKAPIKISNVEFEKSFVINNVNFDNFIDISHCKFGVAFKDDTHNNGYYTDIMFFNVRFNHSFAFRHSKAFSGVEFSEVFFKENTTFIHSTFHKVLSFKKCTFYKTAEFNSVFMGDAFMLSYVDFKNEVIFTSALVQYDISFVGVAFRDSNIVQIAGLKIVSDFDSLRKKIIRYALDDYQFNKVNISAIILDSFRIIKNIGIEQNNIIHAKYWNKFEMYMNEILLSNELLIKKDENADEISKAYTYEIKRNKILKYVDNIQLSINRLTSDHHTDFLKILLFTLSVIGGYFMINFGLSFDEKIISSICNFLDLGLAIYGVSVVIFLLCLGYEFLFVLKGFSKDKGWLSFIFLAICVAWFCLAYSFNVSEFSVILPMIFIGILAMLFILLANNVKYTFISFAAAGFIGILCTPNIITPFLGAFSEDARNHYLYKAIDELDSQKALDLSRQILAKEPTSELNAKKILKDYKDELKSSKLLNESPELKRAVAIDGGVSRLNIAYYLVLAFCIFALQKTMRKNSIIPS